MVFKLAIGLWSRLNVSMVFSVFIITYRYKQFSWEVGMLGTDILTKAKSHVGEKYIFGANVPLDNPNWTGPWDCAEYVSWLVYQTYGVVFGCGTQNLDDAEPYTGYWAEDAPSRGIVIPADQASKTPGAFLIRKPSTNPKRIGHVGVCIGDGTIYEAAGANLGVRIGPIEGRRWDIGMLLRGVNYTASSGGAIPAPTNPTLILRKQNPAVFDERVVDVQEALKSNRVDPGRVDGLFGPGTERAVSSFQLSKGLIVDGEVGPSTGRALGLTFWGISDPVPPTPDNPPPPPMVIGTDAFGAVVNKSKDFATLRSEYERLFATCVVQDKNQEIASLVSRIAASRDRYLGFVSDYAGQSAENMPWYFVALVHSMEASGDVGRFHTHLHNGDPLTGPTTHYPPGRPSATGSNFSWDESARDALSLEKLDQETDWSLARMLYNFERFNGMGPRGKGHTTAYLWSYSNHYIKGKYIADNVWSDDAVSKQPGVAAILKMLVDNGVVSVI
ncbi:peptidoglycan-binding protein [Devosia sp.]|uniref:peptidoglycan-binding protein n=1 Tax=Devosia sp. TaxID=1871048 RepID=UPI00326572AC